MVGIGKEDIIEPKETIITPSLPALAMNFSRSIGRGLAGFGRIGPVTIIAVVRQMKQKKTNKQTKTEGWSNVEYNKNNTLFHPIIYKK